MNISTNTLESAVDELKQVHRATWAAGDYPAIAAHIDQLPPARLIERLGVSPGQRVLDVATGSGNAALRAAGTGARVTGLDLVPDLLEVAEHRAFEAGLEIDLVAGDAEALPFEDQSFDHVISVFGVQFAPRHRVAAAEMARVCRQEGAIGLVSWTPEGLIGQVFRILSGYLPSPPSFVSPPPLWGDEEHVREIFDGTGFRFSVERLVNPFNFASSEAFMKFFEQSYGPMVKAKERLTAEGTWEVCRGELLELFNSRNQATDGSARFESEFLVTTGRR